MPFRLTFCSLIALAAAMPAAADPVFNRIASFATADNMAAGEDRARETSAEIMTATPDGMMLIYSDSPLKAIGLIDIADPRAPKPLGNIAMPGEPTTTVVLDKTAFVGVNTSDSFTQPSGVLASVDLGSKRIVATCDLGGQPDSVALSPRHDMIAVAIENERDEDVNDGALPQMPAGFVVRLPVKDGQVDCANLERIDLTDLAAEGGDDPEPEYLDFNADGDLVVTLQENNHIAVIGADGTIAAHFSAGTVDLDGIDTEKDGKLDFTGSLRGVPREPDTVAWLDNDHFATANEGDYKGGSRGFTIWNRDGTVVHESGPAFEHELIRIGHYPEKRSDKKGVEPEALKYAEFDGQKLLFVGSERGSAIAVYDVADPANPSLKQILPSGIGPEGLVAIPQRNLFASANETDLGEDGGARAHVMIFERAEGAPAYPALISDEVIGWGALSGLTVDPADPAVLYAVSDSVYKDQPAIYRIQTGTTPARITQKITVTEGGKPAAGLDLEGIAADGQGGFWLASEGNAEKGLTHRILHVNGAGAVLAQVELPTELTAGATRFGLEGIARAADGTLWMAVQREWKDDPKGQVKLLRHDPATGEWSAVRYPLEAGEGWVGLSEIAIHKDRLYLIERDNLIGDKARLKQVTSVALDGLKPAALGGDLPLVDKQVVRDLIPDLKRWNGYVQDKVEGMAISPDGTVWVVTDNDGVDDASGETLFWSFGLETQTAAQ